MKSKKSGIVVVRLLRGKVLIAIFLPFTMRVYDGKITAVWTFTQLQLSNFGCLYL